MTERLASARCPQHGRAPCDHALMRPRMPVLVVAGSPGRIGCRVQPKDIRTVMPRLFERLVHKAQALPVVRRGGALELPLVHESSTTTDWKLWVGILLLSHERIPAPSPTLSHFRSVRSWAPRRTHLSCWRPERCRREQRLPGGRASSSCAAFTGSARCRVFRTLRHVIFQSADWLEG